MKAALLSESGLRLDAKVACSGHTGMPMGADKARRHGDGRAGTRQCHKQKIIASFCLPIQECVFCTAVLVLQLSISLSCISCSFCFFPFSCLSSLFYVSLRRRACRTAEVDWVRRQSFLLLFFSQSVLLLELPRCL